MTQSQGSDCRVMCALAVIATVNDTVLPALVAEGRGVRMIWDPTVALMARIAAGESADAIVAIGWAIDRTPSSSPTMRSPGVMTMPSIAIGTFTSPGPDW